MTDLPRYGQRANMPRQDFCPKHPGTPAVGYCKRCGRPACEKCNIPTEVGSICKDCAKPKARFSMSLGRSQPVVTLTLVSLGFLGYLLNFLLPLNRWFGFSPVYAIHEPWRFLTVVLVHGGLMHVVFNMLMLYILGVAIERSIGHWRFLGLFIVSAIGGSVFTLGWTLVNVNELATFTVGASGAIYGLLGAILVEQRRTGVSTTSIIVLLGINLFWSFLPGNNVSWQSHLGGLIAGLLLAWIYATIASSKKLSAKAVSAWTVVATALSVLVLAGATWGIYATLLSQLTRL